MEGFFFHSPSPGLSLCFGVLCVWSRSGSPGVDSFESFAYPSLFLPPSSLSPLAPPCPFPSPPPPPQYSYELNFNQVSLSHPTLFEQDGEIRELYPSEARLRHLTYSAPMFVDITCKQYKLNEQRQYGENDEPFKRTDFQTVSLGYVPLMLKSDFCMLKDKSDLDLSKVGECVFDQGGYFVINGSEKVIIAQERMSNNHVYVFRKQQPHKYEWVCETRSAAGARPTSTMFLQMYGTGARNAIDGHQIRSTLPYIRTDIPVVVIFRALGLNADKVRLGAAWFCYLGVVLIWMF